MASRRVMLVGHDKGPWVDVSRVPKPVLRIRGLSAGQNVLLHLVVDGETVPAQLHEECGDFDITRAQWARVEAVGQGKFTKLICEIVSQRIADALRSS